MTVNYNPPIVTNGLVLNLDAGNRRSYPGAGTVWRDLSGLGNNGTLTNGPTFSAANGGSISLDGSNDYVEITTRNTNLEFQPTQSFSVFCWFYDLNNSSVGSPISNMVGFSPYSGWDINISNSTEIHAHLISTWSSNAIKVGVTFDYVANANKWVNVGYTYNGTSPANATDALDSINFYVNGVLTTTGKRNLEADGFNTTSETITYNASQRLRIGGRWASGSARDPFALRISNSLIYNRALSASEIAQNFNALRGRFGI